MESSELDIAFEDLAHDGPLDNQSRIELDVEARVIITHAGRVLFDWPMVPVLELASQLRGWFAYGLGARLPFEYDSVEHTDVLFAFKPTSVGWTVEGDVVPDPPLELSEAELRTVAEGFVERVTTAVAALIPVDVSPILDPGRWRWRHEPPARPPLGQ
jgi:hypothetical protein